MKVEAAWDSVARVWTVTDSEVPGLVAEAATTRLLCAKLQRLVPELLEANGLVAAQATALAISFRQTSDRDDGATTGNDG